MQILHIAFALELSFQKQVSQTVSPFRGMKSSTAVDLRFSFAEVRLAIPST
jgi:hypothetical protein